ncbi:MAG: M48 family metalloprotease [Phycisphaerae bacterium]|nr:M48 family metalloprotease [Phycisphaerae bacterium]
MKTFRLIVGCLLLASPVMSAGCNKVFLFSREDEIALGEKYGPEFEAEYGGRVDDARVQEYVSSIGLDLTTAAERDMPYQFALLRSHTPNAFAVPGGRIYVTVGLMKDMTNERQLAAVLGHEIGHIVHRDSAKGLQRQLGVELLAAIVGEAVGGGGGTAAKTAAKVVGGLVNLRYSRDQEYNADQAGIKHMAAVGYNPWGMVELLRLLEREKEAGTLGEMLSTHPLTSKRIEEVEDTLREDYPAFSPTQPDPNAGRFMAMHGRIVNLPPPPPKEDLPDVPDDPAPPAETDTSASSGARPPAIRIPDVE